MRSPVSICAPFSRVVAVFVGRSTDGSLYVDIAPAVAVYCREDEDGPFITLLFHRDGCGVGTERELMMNDKEVCETFNAPWSHLDDESELSTAIATLKAECRRKAPVT